MSKTQSYADAAALASEHVGAIKQQIHLFTDVPSRGAWHPMVRYRAEIARKLIARSVAASQFFGIGDESRAADLSRMREDELMEMRTWESHIAIALQFAAQDAGVLKLWERYRIAYSIDQDLWSELGDADDTTEIPRGILSKLPHPDPFVALPEPIVIPTFDGLFQRIEGFFVTGRFAVSDQGGYLLTSTERAPNSLSLLLCSRVMRADGSHNRNRDGHLDWSWVRISLDDNITVGEMLKLTKLTFKSAARDINWECEVELAMRRCVAILLYLCASNADLQTMPRPAPTRRVKGGKTTMKKPVQVVAVGWRLGAQLRAYQQAHSTAYERAEPSGRHVRPHVRRAHFHTYHVGPQRSQTDIKWVSAVPVNFAGYADVTTVIGVPKSKSKTEEGK